MADLTILEAAVQTMSSREIAELTGKRHDNVLLVCRSLMSGGVCPEIKETPYRHPQNGQMYFEYQLNKRDSLVLVARLSPEFTARVVDRWQELEAKQTALALPDFANPAAAARAWADQFEGRLKAETERKQLAAENAALAPRAAVAEMIAASEGLTSMADAAKRLGTGRNRLFELLRARGVFAGRLPKQRYIEQGYFVVKENPIEVHGVMTLNAQAFVTAKGLVWMAEKIDGERRAG